MNNACIIGDGLIAEATGKVFNIERFYVLKQKDNGNITLWEAAKSNYIFVCLSNFIEVKGENVEDFAETINKLSRFDIFAKATLIVRSKVFPGFTRTLQNTLKLKNLVYNPFFNDKDVLLPKLVVIGADTPELREKVKGLYQGRFKYNEPIVTDSITAEMISCYYDGQITNKNLLEVCQEKQANYTTVKNTLNLR